MDGSKQKKKTFKLTAVFKNETVHGTFPMEGTVYTAEISVFEVALKIIEQRRELNSVH